MKDDDLYLGHILEAVARILSYTSGGRDAFLQDLKTQDAVIRNLQIIAEASKKVSAETRVAHPEIPWKDMAGMRDRVVHGRRLARHRVGCRREPPAVAARKAGELHPEALICR